MSMHHLGPAISCVMLHQYFAILKHKV